MSIAARGLIAAIGLLAPCGSAEAQGYRLRLDSRVQSVAFRGVERDSVLATDVVAGPTGGFVTADGFSVTCRSGETYCTFFRPGPEQRGGPFVTTGDLALWGLGLPGLSARATARVGTDLGRANVWPGTEPAVQLIEGIVEYASDLVTVQAGRTHVFTRFGFNGFDGAKAILRGPEGRLSGTVYGGWGLARGVALPVTSPALNPLDDFQPRERQLIAGGDVAWALPRFRGKLVYQREVDPRSDYFVSERGGFDMVVQPLGGLSVSGGIDYDFANGWLGSAEAVVGYATPDGAVAGTIGARRYRPHFELWTVWGAFSPVPYRAAFASVSVVPIAGLELRARGEAYAFDEADAATPLVDVEDSGWRWSLGGTYALISSLIVNAGYHVEFGPGASSLGVRGDVMWQPIEHFRVTAHVATLERPLEFRFNKSSIWMYGIEAEYRTRSRLRLHAGLVRYDETRDRPDAAAFDWDQLRLTARVSVLLAAGAESGGLHPAILRIPEREDRR